MLAEREVGTNDANDAMVSQMVHYVKTCQDECGNFTVQERGLAFSVMSEEYSSCGQSTRLTSYEQNTPPRRTPFEIVRWR